MSKSTLSTRWAQMSKQEQIIEKKKMEIQAKIESQKQAAALAAQAKLQNPTQVIDDKSMNIFSNDGSFMSQFKSLLEKQKQDKVKEQEKEKEENAQPEENEWQEEFNNRDHERERNRDRDYEDRRRNDDRGSRDNRNRRETRNHRRPSPTYGDENKTEDIPSLMEIPFQKPQSHHSPNNDVWDNSYNMSGPPGPMCPPGMGPGPNHMGNQICPPLPPMMPPGGPNMPSDWRPPGGPNRPPNGPKMAPGGPNMQSDWRPQGGAGGPNMPPGGPNMPPGGPNIPPGGPNMPPGGPNMPPGGPNMPPGGPNMTSGGPNMPSGGTKMPPGGPNMPPGGPNMPTVAPNMPTVAPNMPSDWRPQGGPGMPPGGPNMPSDWRPLGGPNMPSGGPNMPSDWRPNMPSDWRPNGPNMPPRMMPPGGPMMPPGGPMMPPGGPMMPPGGPMMPPGGPMPPDWGPPGMMPLGGQNMPNRPMPPFMGRPPFPPNMPPGFFGPNGPMSPFFGPPFPGGPMMRPPNCPPNMMNNMPPFMGQFRPNFGNNNGNCNSNPPFNQQNSSDNNSENESQSDNKAQNIPLPPMPLPLPQEDSDRRNEATAKREVFSPDSMPPGVRRAAEEVSIRGDQWESEIKQQHPNMWFLHNTNSTEYKTFRMLVNQLREANMPNSIKTEIKPEDKYEPEFSLEDDDSNDGYNNHDIKKENNTSYNNPHPWSMGGVKREQAGSQSDEESEAKKERKRRKKSRWGDDPAVDIKPPGIAGISLPPEMSGMSMPASMSGIPMPPGMGGMPMPPGMSGMPPGMSGMLMPPGMGGILPPMPRMPVPPMPKMDDGGLKMSMSRNNMALMQYAMTNYGTTQLSQDDWKKCEDNFKLNLLYQDMLKKRQEVEKMAAQGKHKYEYDSDEDTADGTWEHRLRAKEMTATEIWATELTKQAAGKHHIGDFLPPEELKKFMEKYSAAKDGKELDFSDYKEFKLKEDNVGFKMLQKLGWSEGQGLGAEGSGIVDPINKSNQAVANLGLGANTGDGVSPDDDEFDAYRKRMMLAYRFRPNPLNNPRRPYY